MYVTLQKYNENIYYLFTFIDIIAFLKAHLG